MLPAQISTPQSPKPCHNCRRSRLKCDRSLPHCRKCLTKGRECLGYARLLRWEQGIASRGKMVGRKFWEDVGVSGEEGIEQRLVKRRRLEIAEDYGGNGRMASPLGLGFLWDPVFQDLGDGGRRYLAYFADRVCKDLVLYDGAKRNHFRYLVPLTHQHQLLLHVIIATSALHFSNAQHTSWPLESPIQCSDEGTTTSSPSASSSISTLSSSEAYQDALVAKQRALGLLKSAITNIDSANVDVILGTVLLFVQFELIDSGRDAWKPHINGARQIFKILGVTRPDMGRDMSELRRCLVVNCFVYDIMGTTLTTHGGLLSDDGVNFNVSGLLQDAEGNHCASFPVILLQLLQEGTRITQSFEAGTHKSLEGCEQEEPLASLINTAQSFDPLEWASQLQQNSPTNNDLPQRTHIASAHRAAVCIYLARLQQSISPDTQVPQDLETLLSEIVNRLSQICADDALLPAIAWPTFVAGAESNDPAVREWAKMRFMQIWDVQPWGLIKSALEVLDGLWRGRSIKLLEDGGATGEMGRWNWVEEVKGMGVDWLIL